MAVRAALCVFAALVGLATASLGAEHASRPHIPITAKPITAFDLSHPERVRFGEFEFAGGLVLQSDAPDFGALSGLRMLDHSRLLSVTDTGLWFAATILRDSSDRPVGLSKGQIAPLVDENNAIFENKWQSDSEGLAIKGGNVFVSTEQDARILKYKFPAGSSLPQGPAVIIDDARPKPRLRYNFGMEAIAAIPIQTGGGKFAGELIALSEYSLNPQGNIRGFLSQGEHWKELSVRPRDFFFVTDAAFLPNGDLLILERRFSLGTGPAVRIRRVAGNDIVAGAVLDGDVVLDLTRAQQIDNLEGLSVFRDRNGQVRIALVSDDNHFELQRTLYLEFKWTGQ